MEPAPRVPSARLQAEESGAWAGAGPGLVFAGCGGTDVALAQAFWNSVTLQPPLESCLGPPRGSLTPGHRKLSSFNGHRRSLMVDAERNSLAQPSATSRMVEAETQGNSGVESVVEEKAQYLQKAKRREEIIALLKKQRKERIMKEAISRPHRPKTKTEESKLKVSESDLEDQERVRALI